MQGRTCATHIDREFVVPGHGQGNGGGLHHHCRDLTKREHCFCQLYGVSGVGGREPRLLPHLGAELAEHGGDEGVRPAELPSAEGDPEKVTGALLGGQAGMLKDP